MYVSVFVFGYCFDNLCEVCFCDLVTSFCVDCGHEYDCYDGYHDYVVVAVVLLSIPGEVVDY